MLAELKREALVGEGNRHDPRRDCTNGARGILMADNGATFEVDLEETKSVWQANFRIISANGDRTETPGLRVFPAKADAVAWITSGLAAHGFVYEPSE